MTFTATLAPKTKLDLSQPEELQVTAALLTDAFGRPLDGNDDGTPAATSSPPSAARASGGAEYGHYGRHTERCLPKPWICAVLNAAFRSACQICRKGGPGSRAKSRTIQSTQTQQNADSPKRSMSINDTCAGLEPVSQLATA